MALVRPFTEGYVAYYGSCHLVADQGNYSLRESRAGGTTRAQARPRLALLGASLTSTEYGTLSIPGTFSR